MGWPRRRRQQQQQLRRRAAKEYLLACCSAAIDMCGSVMSAPTTTTMPTKAPTHQHYPATASSKQPAKTAAATWHHTASPHKPKQKQLVSSGRRHRGLREKLYSVDSLAETEPEDNDDLDDDDETASESGDLSPQYHNYHHSSASKLKIEPVIPEETPVGTKSLLHDDSEELVETDDEEEGSYANKVSPAATETSDEALEQETETPEPAAELLVTESKPETTVPTATASSSSASVDGDETESEDEATTLDAVISNCSVTVEDVSSTSTDLFGQELASPSESQKPESETSESSESATKHAPFLFPAPYFPGDVDEYESDIYEMLLRREKVHHVESDYFGFQPHVTIVMRAMLLDWLVEVHNHFNLQPETLYLTVNYIDRFLATVPIKRENFQLVALTALLIASKFEEVHPVDIEDLVYICERSYTAQQIVQFEKQMLAALKFNLVVPTCSGFLDYYTDKLSSELVVAQLANFFCEQTLLDFHLSAKYVPSVVASSALLLAQCYVEKRRPDLTWVLAFEETTGYYAKDIWCCVHDLSDMLVSLSFDLVAVRTKYRSSRFGRVSDMPHVNVSAMAIE